MRLVGTTKSTIDSVREGTHWNTANIAADGPGDAGPLQPDRPRSRGQARLARAPPGADEADRRHHADDRRGSAGHAPAAAPASTDGRAPPTNRRPEQDEDDFDADSVFAKLKSLKGDTGDQTSRHGANGASRPLAWKTTSCSRSSCCSPPRVALVPLAKWAGLGTIARLSRRRRADRPLRPAAGLRHRDHPPGRRVRHRHDAVPDRPRAAAARTLAHAPQGARPGRDPDGRHRARHRLALSSLLGFAWQAGDDRRPGAGDVLDRHRHAVGRSSAT